MADLLEHLLPRLFPEIQFQCIPHEGKRDLAKSVPRKLRAWREPGVRFVVMRDQNGADCRQVKAQLVELCKERGGMTCSFESCAENSRRGTSVSRRRSSAHSHMRVNACSVNCAGGDFGIRTRWSILPQPSSNSSRISKSGGARDSWRSTCRGTIVRAAFRSSLKGSKAWSGHTDRPSRTGEVFGAHQASTGSHAWPPAGCRRLVASTS